MRVIDRDARAALGKHLRRHQPGRPGADNRNVTAGVNHAFRTALAAPVPAILPNTAPDIRPVPPG